MAATRVYVTQLDKGYDTNIATAMIDEKSAIDLLNIRWNEGGVIMKRDGSEVWGKPLTIPKALGRLVLPAKREILVIDNTELKRTQDTTGEYEVVSGVTFNPAAEYYHLPQIKKLSYIWNGLDPGAVYDGTTASRPGTMPSALFSVYYKGYHICAGVKDQASRVYFSTIANTSDFTNDPTATTDGPDPDNATEVPGATIFTGMPPDVAQFVDVSASDGDSITLLIEYQDFLIIGKENSLWSLTIDATSKKPVIQLITRAIGCVGYNTAAPVGNDVYFLSDQGPISLGNERNYVGALRTNQLAEKIKSFIDQINPEQWKRATAVYWDKMWILSVPWGNSESINRVIALDTRFGGWTVWDNLDARSWLSHIDAKNRRHLYFIKDGTNTLSEIKPGYYYDNGAGINAYWRSKAIDAGALDVSKRWTYFTLFMRNIGNSAIVSINTELEELEAENIFDGATGSGLGFSQIGLGSWIGPVSDDGSGGGETNITSTDDAWRTSPNLESRTFTFEVRNDKPGENFFLSGFSLEYITLKAYYFDQSHTF